MIKPFWSRLRVGKMLRDCNIRNYLCLMLLANLLTLKISLKQVLSLTKLMKTRQKRKMAIFAIKLYRTDRRPCASKCKIGWSSTRTWILMTCQKNQYVSVHSKSVQKSILRNYLAYRARSKIKASWTTSTCNLCWVLTAVGIRLFQFLLTKSNSTNKSSLRLKRQNFQKKSKRMKACWKIMYCDACSAFLVWRHPTCVLRMQRKTKLRMQRKTKLIMRMIITHRTSPAKK